VLHDRPAPRRAVPEVPFVESDWSRPDRTTAEPFSVTCASRGGEVGEMVKKRGRASEDVKHGAEVASVSPSESVTISPTVVLAERKRTRGCAIDRNGQGRVRTVAQFHSIA